MSKKSTQFPNRIVVELTNVCNIQCDFCPRNLVQMKLGFMEEGLFYKVIDEATQHLPVSLAVFFRGESLLHPKAVTLIQYAKSKGISPVQLSTNGLILDNHLTQALLESELDFISFSIDTQDKKLYNRIRKNSDFEKSRANILHFMKQCQKFKDCSRPAPETQVTSIMTPDYVPGMREFIAFWKNHADVVRIYEEHSANGKLGSLGGTHLVEDRVACSKPTTEMVICWDGSVALCNHDWDVSTNIGNIYNNTISELWTGERYNQIRQMHETCEFSSYLVCKGCDHWKMYCSAGKLIGEKHRGSIEH